MNTSLVSRVPLRKHNFKHNFDSLPYEAVRAGDICGVMHYVREVAGVRVFLF